MASYDGLYLTRGFCFNNSTGAMHDVALDKTVWFVHRTKKEFSANGVGNFFLSIISLPSLPTFIF